MTIDDFETELYDILSTEIDEPAGYGCGYGVTDEGQYCIRGLIEDFIKERESIMSIYRYIVVRTVDEKSSIVTIGTLLAKDDADAERRVIVLLVKDETVAYNVDTDAVTLRKF